MALGGLLFVIGILVAYLYLSIRNKREKQLKFISSYHFHASIREKVKSKYPHLDNAQLSMVFQALRDYFWMCNMAKGRNVAMPSQVVDEAWHEFILFTRAYRSFCDKAIGRFLDHTPTVAMKSRTTAQEGIKRAWRLACAKDGINPATPHRLPLIFSIDGLLNIPGGFTYALDCKKGSSSRDDYCAGHIGCSSGCAGASADDSSGFFDDLFGGSDCGSSCSSCGGD